MTALVPERQHYFILDTDETLLKIFKYPLVRQNNLQVAFILIKMEIKDSIDGLTPMRTNGGIYFTTQNAVHVKDSSPRICKKLYGYIKHFEDKSLLTFIGCC